MISSELLYQFKIGFDVISSNAAPGFTDTEVYSLLNKAEDYLVLESHKNKQWENVYTLITNNSPTTASGSAGLYYISLPANFWLRVEDSSVITRTGFTSTGFVPTEALTTKLTENISIDIKNSFKYAKAAFNDNKVFKVPYSYIESSNLYVISDLYTTVNNINLKYIRKRTAIDVSNTSELPEFMHRLIVDQAIKFAQESIFSQLPNKQ